MHLLVRKKDVRTGPLVDEIATSLQRMRQAVSGLLAGLRPAGLDDFGLSHVLREGAVRELVEANGITFDLRIEDEARHLDQLGDELQTALYRIAQEAATNTVRHAQATRFRVRLRTHADTCSVLLVITDDGVGFDPIQRASGIGVQGIRDRVLSLGGRLRLRSERHGTRIWVRLRVPLA